jgi:hypothetical protein
MSRVFSFRDLLRIPEFSGMNEIMLLHPHMDPAVNRALGELGFSLNHAIIYEASNHRDLSGKVAVGFRAVGEIAVNHEFITSPLATITDRMIAAYNKDPGLAKELAALMGNSITFKDHDYEGEANEDDFPDCLVEADYESKTQEIRELENIRDAIRGNPYDEFGSRKLPRLA